MQEASSLRHPLSRRLLKLRIFDSNRWELTLREQRAFDDGLKLCSEIHRLGWNAARLKACQTFIREFA